MHTDITLDIMDDVTADFGQKMRAFRQQTCQAFETKELPREVNARLRRQNQKIQASRNLPIPGPSSRPDTIPTGSGIGSGLQPAVPSTVGSKAGTRRPKSLNLNTYKHHALGDYVSTIRRYGTTDSYSTEAVRGLFLHTLDTSIDLCTG